MIFYFSGTGNNRWLAYRLGHLLSHSVVSIKEVSLDDLSFQEKECIGFVFPIYAWGVPKVMLTFIKELVHRYPSIVNHPAFAVAGCGETIGNALDVLDGIIPLMNQYSISMPNNYVLGSEIDSQEVIKKKMDNAEKQLQSIAEDILHHQRAIRINKGRMPAWKTTFIAPMMAKFAPFIGKKFWVDERCIGCGQCVRDCQFDNITMLHGRPTWKNQCQLCLACINHCPQQAIQHGKQTIHRRRYYLEDKEGDF